MIVNLLIQGTEKISVKLINGREMQLNYYGVEKENGTVIPDGSIKTQS